MIIMYQCYQFYRRVNFARHFTVTYNRSEISRPEYERINELIKTQVRN